MHELPLWATKSPKNEEFQITELFSKMKKSVKQTDDFYMFVKDQLSAWGEIDNKRMFGVKGIYKEGLMFGVIKNDTVYLKVDDSNKYKFIDAGSETLKVFKTNSEVLTYYRLPENVLDDAQEFVEWAKEAYRIQLKKK